MAARLDPEDVQAVLRAYQALAGDVVGNVDGHVAQYLGDGVLVYFGYPAAHEDDPARAVSAALEIAREVPLLGRRLDSLGLAAEALQVRIGIHTGPVVIGAIGAQQRTEQLASGSSVNIAARLAAAAAPGTVMISEAVARRVGGLFAMTALGDMALKGLAAPVTAFRPVAQHGSRSRLAAWGAGSGRPIVGRDAVIAELLAGWAAVRRPPAADALPLLLRGEAGIGKSRLVQALRQRLASEAHGWIACHGTAMQQARDFFPIIEAIRASLDLEGGEPEADARARLAAALDAAHVEDGPGRAALAVLLGLAGSAAGLTADDRQQAMDLIIDWWLRLARLTPLVLALEDLHWFDPSSLELISRLLARAGDAPILIIGTERPDWQPPWPARIIDLPPLGGDQIGAIVTAILGDAATPALVAKLVERSDGVPLYAEELAQSWIEQARRGGDAGVPVSLQDSIMARLDRLGSNKRLVQLGALLGRSFSHELIAAASELEEPFLLPGLADIVAGGILHRSGVPPRATYVFRHALLQDAAADSLLRQHYRRDNAAIAALLRDRFPALAAADPGRVARHFDEAGSAREAIGWYRRAGQQAQQRAAYREAEAAYGRALALAEPLAAAGDGEELAAEIYAEIGRILQITQGYAAPATRQAIGRARRPADQARDKAFLRREREQFQATLTRGAYAEARAAVAAVMARWQGDADDPDLLFFRLGAFIQTGFFTGDLASVERAFADMTPWIDGPGQQQPAGNTISAIGIAGLAAWWQGDPALARRRIEMALGFAEATNDPYDRAMSLHYLSQLHLIERDPVAAAEVGARLLALAEAQGFAYLAALVQGPIGWSAAQLGRGSDHARTMRATLDAMFAAGARIAGTTQLNRLAEVQLGEGAADAALATIEQALAFNPEEEIYRPASLLLRARMRATAAPAAARADLIEALALADAQGAHGIALPIGNALARLWLAEGEAAQARAALMAGPAGPGGNADDLAARQALLARLQPLAVAAAR